ncbi:MAG: MBL fold metallo-hydrolase [Pedosphaera sp.]|nr:MBL fold metallo-hydrolase [Pedosphaera sp.]
MNLPYRLIAGAVLAALPVFAEVNKPQEIAPGVWFHEGDIGRKGHCNNGWIIFGAYVLVIDGNFPSGAQEIIPKIRAQTDKPIRFTFDTHHHGDHAYGNQVWADLGATLVAHEGVLSEMKKYEPGYFAGGKPGRWEDTAKSREDVAKSKLHPPTLLFPRQMSFEDGTHRVELHHFGVAHTRGDGFAWLPAERILFTGDACVNGPYNSMGDSDTAAWVETLEAARRLEPRFICPGHGLMGGPEVLDNQIAYLKALRSEVQKLFSAGKSPAEVKAALDTIKSTIQRQESLATYLGGGFESQVEKIYVEMGGKPFQSSAAPARRPRRDDEVLARK